MKRLREFWREFRNAEPGSRFRDRYRRRAELRARGERLVGRPITILLAIICCIIAVPLMLTPGPAVLFWGLAGFLISGESAWLARSLDWMELRIRERWKRWSDRKKNPEIKNLPR